MLITFLESKVRLAKTFSIDGKANYPIEAYKFTSHSYDIKSIQEFYKNLKKHALEGHCLLKGICHKPLNNESRKGSHIREDPTAWLCLDIDGLPLMSPEEFIQKILPAEFQNVSYIMQYSASMKLDKERGLSGHLFFLLEREIEAPIIKKWLTWLNLTSPELHAELKLTKNGRSLKYPLDITACQNDKLLFIAPPNCIEPVKDPLTLNDRYQLQIKEQPTVLLNTKAALKENLEGIIETKVMELRKQQGIADKSKPKYKITKQGDYVLTNPDKATVTGEIRKANGFVYLNINGGDSYGYYHLEHNPYYLYNFKGEPVVMLADFVPDYWNTVKSSYGGKVGTKEFITFREWRADTYYNGWYDEETNEVELNPVRSKDKIADFLASNGVPMPDPIHDWTYKFDPTDERIFDAGDKFVNRFVPTKYMLEARKLKPVTIMPDYIHKIIYHAVGSDEQSYEYFVNWLAYIYQYRRMTQTAWVLHGVEGTGKNAIIEKIVQPTLGENYVKVIGLRDYREQFNYWMETCLICMVDESEISRKDKEILQKVKNQITAERNNIRRMHQNLYEVDMFINFIFSSNELEVLAISETDRRFNVAKRQQVPFKDINGGSPLLDLQQIKKELLAFTSFMLNYPVNVERVKTPMDNQAKKDMQEITQFSHENFFRALRTGDFEFFIQSYWEKPNSREIMEFEEYKTAIKCWAARGQEAKLARDEVRLVYRFLQSDRNITANKFTSYLKHYQINTKKMRIEGFDGPVMGIAVRWKENPQTMINLLDEKIVKLKR